MEEIQKKPNLFQAFLPILVLIVLLSMSVKLIWGDSSLDGANQVALIFATLVAAIIGWRLKYKWKDMLDGISESIQSALPAILILLLIGALAGTWLISGVVPTMIYYGLKILSPKIFLVAACIISAIVSLATGSSWSTIATIGVALLGIGQALGISNGLIAGAIISGAYFGDKMSPMSDTTNLAPAVSGTDLFTHIRYMLYTTIPSITITLVLFTVIGFFVGTEGDTEQVNEILSAINESFYISPILFIVPVIVIVLIIMKIQAIPALFFGVLLGGIAAMVFQPNIVNQNGRISSLEAVMPGPDANIVWMDEEGNELGHDPTLNTAVRGKVLAKVTDAEGRQIGWATFSLPKDGHTSTSKDVIVESNGIDFSFSQSNYFITAYKAIVDAMTVTTTVSTSNADVNDLLETGGMYGMLKTIWLIICAMSFGGIMERLGLLSRLTEAIIARVQSSGSLIATTAVTCVGFNLTASDQYLAIVVPGKMFSKAYRDRGLAAQNLSRTLEDSGTVTSVLVPWNTCGAAQSQVLGIATGEYFIYCFFNIISPVMTIIYGYFGIKIAKLRTEKE